MGGRRGIPKREGEWAGAESRRPSPTVRATPSTHSAAGLLELQRAVGNRAAYRLATGAVVQPKLRVGPAGDHFEREADQVADEVMRNLTATTVVSDLEETRISRSVDDGVVGLEGGPLGSDAEAAIDRDRGQGARLPEPLRGSLEGAFGADFSGVRVHAGPSADALSQSMQARAFTVGRDIFFGRGQYQPQSTGGQRLLAHELTHTIQQAPSPLGEGQDRRSPSVDEETG